MYNNFFIDDFTLLGIQLTDALSDISKKSLFETVIENSLRDNPLFTKNMQCVAISAICNKFLRQDKLEKWLNPYRNIIKEQDRSVAIIMAGNIPLVGFHDLLAVLATGYKALVKLSSKDKHLLPALVSLLFGINSYWRQRIQFVEELPESPDIVIVTGSNETALYFESYYKDSRKLIRGSRSSLALLYGGESLLDLEALAKDVFLYYGMGCRSISTIMIPSSFDLQRLILSFKYMESEITAKDYLDAYKYQKALSSMTNEKFIDGGFYLLKENDTFIPPLGVVNIIRYECVSEARKFIESNLYRLQCVVNYNHYVSFGETQYPEIDQYADGVNSLEFLMQIV